MSRYNPFYFFGQAVKSLWRNSVMNTLNNTYIEDEHGNRRPLPRKNERQ